MKHRLTKTVAVAGLAGVVGYFWYTSYVSLETVAIGVVGLIFFHGFAVVSEKVDGLHWRVADLARRLGDPFEIENGQRR
jgi:divalent metal cation (Fe/Co/Zn/Cd) transporter